MFDRNSDGCVGRTEIKDFFNLCEIKLDENDKKELDQFVRIFKDFKETNFGFSETFLNFKFADHDANKDINLVSTNF